MGSLKFELIVFGGIADEPEAKVAADKVADVLRGMARDVQEICRNLSTGDDSATETERTEGCRIYVEGPPQKGKSLAFPMAADADWGILSIQAYAAGVVELRESKILGLAALPKGFDESILHRIRAYCQGIAEDHDGFAVAIPPVNGSPAVRATFDARLKSAVNLKLAALEHERAMAPVDQPDWRIHGYSIQGVLYEMSDPEYLNPDGKISVEVDARDGRHWVCNLDKRSLPENLQDLFLTEVLVTGTATMRARKPLIDADSFVPLPGVSEPLKALDELIALCGNMRGEPVQDFMDRVRERD